ncbi:hypothetical protein GGF49_001177 [Coemansia sp. RSA 1853]|nr:hypothetical protein GGF49_001177 [Coemansia sp. RSA 1853]
MGQLLTYVLGVLTVPALVAAALLVFWLTAEDSELPSEATMAPETAAAQKAESQASAYSERRTGWLHITRSLGVRPMEAADGQTKLTDMVTRGIAKWIQGKRNEAKPSTGATDGTQDFYYVVLDGDTLVMYDGEAMKECRGVIIMSKHRVSLHHRPNVSESQVYSRRTPIRLSPVNDGLEAQMCKRQVAEYFIYADRPTDKEDWYFALLWSSLEYGLPNTTDDDSNDAGGSADNDSHAANATGPGASPEQLGSGGGDSSQSPVSAKPRLTREQRERQRLRMRRACMEPDYSGLAAVLQTISKRGTTAHTGPVREDEWLNAILGRMFIGAYKTEWVRQHFIRKMQTKFDRVQRPMFLERVVVADLDVGDLAPVITNPKLESFHANGQVDMSMYMHYMGGFRLVLNTAVKLGALRLSISLSVVLQSLAGKMLLRIKPAPSNRFWIAFYEMPRISLKLSPVFMQKQVKYALVSQAIEKQIYDMVRLSLVLPNLDDTVFFPTLLEDGGILERSLKEYNDRGLNCAEDDAADGDPSSAASDSASRDGSHEFERTNETSHQTAKTQTCGTPELALEGVRMSEHAATVSGAITGNSRAAQQESRSASRFAMTTPTPISENSPGSSNESLMHQSPLARDVPGKRQSSSSTLSSQTSPSIKSGKSMSTASQTSPSIKSSMSISAASLFKRAKNSQAAESAKSWWQNIQQNGISGDNQAQTAGETGHHRSSSGAQRQLPPAVASDDDAGEADEPSSRSQVSSPVPFDISHINSRPRTASEDVVHSKAAQFPLLNGGGGASSSVYSKRSSMVADSLLVRRRPAAASMSGETELPSAPQV